MAKEVPHLIRGMSAAARLLGLLIEEINNRGGCDEMLYFLTVDGGQENVGKIADLIVSLDWRIPKSVLMERAYKLSLSDNHDQRTAESDSRFYWGCALRDTGIPIVSFNADEDNWPVPAKLREQLQGVPLEMGTVVKWEEEPHLLVSYAPQRGLATEGELMDMGNLHFLHLSPLRYFDLNR